MAVKDEQRWQMMRKRTTQQTQHFLEENIFFKISFHPEFFLTFISIIGIDGPNQMQSGADEKKRVFLFLNFCHPLKMSTAVNHFCIK